MTDRQHPITPPPELVNLWMSEDAPWDSDSFGVLTARPSQLRHIATQAARWGADQELEACCEWVENECPGYGGPYEKLRAARRPKPPSLAEQALEEIQQMEGAMYSADLGCDFTATRAALERLQHLEQESNDN